MAYTLPVLQLGEVYPTDLNVKTTFMWVPVLLTFGLS